VDHTVQLTGRLAPRESWSADRCSIRSALAVAGNATALLILREAFYGTSRFDDFAERVGISEPVAAARLRDLVEHGLLERQPYREAGQRTRMGYRLTDKGAELLPALVALMQWGDRWLAPGGPPVVLRHRDCGETVQARLTCDAGHQPPVSELELTVGPGAPRADRDSGGPVAIAQRGQAVKPARDQA
jgi:DNA-binding HxlR family transcriptional regulator